jgi:hypothetical protein
MKETEYHEEATIGSRFVGKSKATITRLSWELAVPFYSHVKALRMPNVSLQQHVA